MNDNMSHIYGWGILNLVKMSVLPSVIQIKIPASYFMAINQLILKFIWRGKRPRIANTTLKKQKNKIGGDCCYPTFHNLILKGYSNQENRIDERIDKEINEIGSLRNRLPLI